jgi:hypothetical protein
MANIRHLTCPQCGTSFTSQWPRNMKFCSHKCMLADWRNRHREQINEYSRNRRKTTPITRSEINRRYRNSVKGKETYAAWETAHKAEKIARLTKRYQEDSCFREMLKSRQKAHRMLRAAKNVPYMCQHCDCRRRLHAHHKDFNPSHNILENLMWLCHPHHMQVHLDARNNQRRKLLEKTAPRSPDLQPYNPTSS